MRLDPLMRYRPTRVDDGEGGFDVSLGIPSVLYGIVSVHHTDLVLVYRYKSDILPEDIVYAEGAFYRVLSLFGPHSAPMKKAFVERITKPIVPLIGLDCGECERKTPAFWDVTITDVTGCSATNGIFRCTQIGSTPSWRFLSASVGLNLGYVESTGRVKCTASPLPAPGNVTWLILGETCEFEGELPYDSQVGPCVGVGSTCLVKSSLAVL